MTTTEYRICCYAPNDDKPSQVLAFTSRLEAVGHMNLLARTTWARLELQRLTVEMISSHEKTLDKVRS